MITIPIRTLENAFGVNFYKRKGLTCIGLDTATTTGYCISRISHNQTVKIETGYIKIKEKDEQEKYKIYIEIFDKLIKKGYNVVVEDTFMGLNAKGFKQITRIGGIAFTVAVLKGCKVKFLMATQARKNLGLKGNAKKKDLQGMINNLLGTNITHDETDAVILALNGLIKYAN